MQHQTLVNPGDDAWRLPLNRASNGAFPSYPKRNPGWRLAARSSDPAAEGDRDRGDRRGDGAHGQGEGSSVIVSMAVLPWSRCRSVARRPRRARQGPPGVRSATVGPPTDAITCRRDGRRSARGGPGGVCWRPARRRGRSGHRANQPGAGRLGGRPGRHVRMRGITVGANGPVIEDLGSSNGTWVERRAAAARRARSRRATGSRSGRRCSRSPGRPRHRPRALGSHRPPPRRRPATAVAGPAASVAAALVGPADRAGRVAVVARRRPAHARGAAAGGRAAPRRPADRRAARRGLTIGRAAGQRPRRSPATSCRATTRGSCRGEGGAVRRRPRTPRTAPYLNGERFRGESRWLRQRRHGRRRRRGAALPHRRGDALRHGAEHAGRSSTQVVALRRRSG